MNDHSAKVADGTVATAIAVWFLSHLAQINEVLQFFLLLVSIIAGLVAMRYHWKRTPK